MARNYVIMMLIGNLTDFDGYAYTWQPWGADLERWLIDGASAKDAESVEMALFALPEGYTTGRSADGSVKIYDADDYQAEIYTDKERRIYAPDYPKNHYFSKIETIWKREDGKKVYNNRIGRYAGRLDDATINMIYGAIAYDLGEKAACQMMTSKKLLTAYYLEKVQVIPVDMAAGGLQDGVLVHLYGDSYGNGDCILPGYKVEDLASDADVEDAIRHGHPIARFWEDDAGIMWECCEEEDDDLLIDPTDGEET